MLKKSLVLMLIMALAVTAFAGCGAKTPTEADKSEEPMVLRWNLGADPKTLDPQLNAANEGGHVINNTFEGLMRELPEGKLEPAMAEKYELSEDGKTYIFHLREAKWSDGQPVKAQDFEYAWKRALNPSLVPEPSEYSFQLFYIKGAQEYFEGKGTEEDVAVKALDDKTLQVELVAPTEYFLELTGFYTYMPVRKDMVEQDPENWARKPELAVSNGPFKLAEYKMGDRVVLEKNPEYWAADKVKIDRIEAVMIVEDSTALTAYEAGELDVLHNVPNQEIPRLIANDPSFYIRPKVGTYFYNFNVTKKPFDDVRVRRALSLAIDRTAIVEKVTKAGEIPATGFVPPRLKDDKDRDFRETSGDFGIDPKAAKVEEAKALLAEAGYPDGKDFPSFELLYNTNEGHKAIAEAIQEMWKQNLGINVTLQNQEWAVFQESKRKGQYQMCRAGWTGDYLDPMTMLDIFTSYSELNDPKWKNKDYDKLIEKAKSIVGEERFNTLYEAEKMMMDEMIVMPIYYYVDKLAVKANVKNVEMVGTGHWWFGYGEIEAQK